MWPFQGHQGHITMKKPCLEQRPDFDQAQAQKHYWEDLNQ